MQCELYPNQATPRQVAVADLRAQLESRPNIFRPSDHQPDNGQPANGQPANGQPANGQPHHRLADPETLAAAEAGRERLDNIGMRPRPQTRIPVGLQVSQWADSVLTQTPPTTIIKLQCSKSATSSESARRPNRRTMMPCVPLSARTTITLKTSCLILMSFTSLLLKHASMFPDTSSRMLAIRN